MIKLIRNNQKKFIAGTGVVLMITFVAGYGGTGGTGHAGPVERELGRANGRAVLSGEVANARAELTAVDTYARQTAQQEMMYTGGHSLSLADRLLPGGVSQEMLRRPDLFVCSAARPPPPATWPTPSW